MIQLRTLPLALSLMVLTLGAAADAQEPKAPAAAGFDAQACARHCQEMAAAHQKTMEAHRAMAEERDAAWKEIQAQLGAARNARGEKKVAALEAAIEKLVALHEAERKGMAGGKMPGAMGTMACCDEKGAGTGMGMEMGKGMPPGMDCPMMERGPAPHEAAPKPQK